MTARQAPAWQPPEGSGPRKRRLPGSRLAQLIVALNLMGLAVLSVGVLVLGELRQGLVKAKIDDLTTQGTLIGNVIDRAATVGDPQPALDAQTAVEILQVLFVGEGQRARLFAPDGTLIADSYLVADRVDWRPLPPARSRQAIDIRDYLGLDRKARDRDKAQKSVLDLRSELDRAARGEVASSVRGSESGETVVSVSVPVRHVRAVLGVLTLEASDVDRIVAAERFSLIPFILVATAVSLLSSLFLIGLIASPIRSLSRAADRVRASTARAINLPALARRRDEIGDLTRSLEDMTTTLSDRMVEIERFAADVAHEIKNPLTSLSSAIETLEIVEDPAARARLTGILNQDVRRLDRLVTDISNASRLDAELSRDTPGPVDMGRLVEEIVNLYRFQRAQPASVRLELPTRTGSLLVNGREGPLGQVLRNLLDNALSFSPPDAEVVVSVISQGRDLEIRIDDEGPGIPAEALETIFQRFYTSRPKGTAFGNNSGLGLSIARQIIDAHQGHLHAENRAADPPVGAGARFVIRLPLMRAA